LSFYVNAALSFPTKVSHLSRLEREKIDMWSKRPFHKPKGPLISGPILSDNPPTTSDPVHNMVAKKLPALPE
jgi:hypothetical protein